MKKLFASLLLLCLLLTGCTAPNTQQNVDQFVVHFIDVGQADCALLEYNGQFAEAKTAMAEYADVYPLDPEFEKEWYDLEPEFNAIQAIIDARRSRNMTQKELAERTGIDQSDISKIETGNANPSLNTLKRLAEGLDMILKLEFIPKSI